MDEIGIKLDLIQNQWVFGVSIAGVVVDDNNNIQLHNSNDVMMAIWDLFCLIVGCCWCIGFHF